MSSKALQYWEVWYPNAAATGLLIARGLIDPATRLLLHSAPEVITVEVKNQQGQRLAYGENLQRTLESPMCRIWITPAGDILRADLWPTESDLNSLVLLPGGEVGVLTSWWNSPDQKEWRWGVEFYNTLR